MVAGVITFLYRRLGKRYPLVFMAAELQTALFIVAGTLALFTFYFEGDTSEYLTILVVALVLTEGAILASLWRLRPQIRPLSDWIAGDRDEESTERAWTAAAGLPIVLLRRDLPIPVLISVIPTCIIGIVVLDLPVLAIFPLLAAAVGRDGLLGDPALPRGRGRHAPAAARHQREPLAEADRRTSGRSRCGPGCWSRCPVINLITGLVVAALTSDGGGPSNLGLDVLVALLVATTVSLELTVMLSKSILRPVQDLERAVAHVREGDFDVSVPVTTGDEFGELAASFNQMVEGLAERERLREAFGTYLDREVAEYILSEGFTEEGVEVEVTVLFCDVRGFTEFASEATPQRGRRRAQSSSSRPSCRSSPATAATSTSSRATACSPCSARPEPFPDHADRAVRAACEIAEAVNHEARAGELRVGVGVNSGPVIAGAIGGGGRLNFSVIGGVVNVASRVEQHTRETGDDILITGATWNLVSHRFEVDSRGKVELRGVAEPVSLYAPHRAAAGVAATEDGRDGERDDGDGGSGRRLRLPLPRLLR